MSLILQIGGGNLGQGEPQVIKNRSERKKDLKISIGGDLPGKGGKLGGSDPKDSENSDRYEINFIDDPISAANVHIIDPKITGPIVPAPTPIEVNHFI